MQYIYLILAFLCGAIYPIQGSMNGRLLTYTGNSILTAIISFLVGLIALVTLGVFKKVDWVQLTTLKDAPWWAFLGGILGAFYVATVVVILPRLGMALTFSLIVAGQITLSVILDHFGLLGNPVRQLSIGRFIGLVLLVVAVVLIRKN
jgi:bacterial/archaeal transporter family-2 protein